ncbi:MAG: phenylacetate--CoA ligase [Tepidanaerobacter acetatoxydans]|uniref:phenylacetate--CoA ligase family protein n=1 Tax=Tepidanaerobacter TaxID=499228 RepID=UPI000AD01251|nr:MULTISPECIES: phenylacetate--CoA ligase [Tepidanaerobacter]NLU09871.1 phenylacetate--CoA ligase [Tepidanaerobacter acetatoxydans]
MQWNKVRECMSRDQLRSYQFEKLKETIDRVYHNVESYRQKMQERGIIPEDINSLEDLKLLPFTTKQDLRDNYPYNMFAVPLEEIIRIHASSGTTGKPTVVGYTRRDIANWAELIARCLTMGGGKRESVVQISYGYGLFTGGLGFHYGAEKLGAVVVPTSGGNTRRQVMLMKDLKTEILACTPSYALCIAETLEEMGIKHEELNLKAGIFGAEPWSDNMRKELESKLGLKALDIYGLSEVIGPGVACECMEQQGLHIFEDFFIPEIIDPITEEPLPEGERGELVITTIDKEGLPVIRYKTRDITSISYEHCPCGRTHARIEKLLGRTDDMLIIRGVNVFPSQIESALMIAGDAEPHYLIIVDRKDNLDSMEVLVEVSEKLFADEVRKLEEVRRKIISSIYTTLGINVNVKLVEPHTIERTEGKSKRVIDKRKL